MELIEKYALSFLGVPYKYGGRNRLEGLDCSQLVIEVLISAGVVPHGFDATAQMLYDRFKQVPTDFPKLGALAFYGKSLSEIKHVALCLDDKTMIEAGGGDALTINLPSAIFRSACVRMRPIRYRGDFLTTVMPPYGR
jgi:cell wall-associated NlpC family hydrolase